MGEIAATNPGPDQRCSCSSGSGVGLIPVVSCPARDFAAVWTILPRLFYLGCAMVAKSLNFVVRRAWWLPLYLHGMALTCTLMGTEPDWDKVTKVVLKGMRIKLGEA